MNDGSRNYPNLRFPEFKEKWNTGVFDDLYLFGKTYSFSRDQLTSETGSIRNVHYGDIHTKLGMVVDLDKFDLPRVNEELLSNISEESFCSDGDLIIADASEDYEGVGKTIELINICDKKVVSGLHTIYAKPKLNVFSLGYMGYYTNSIQVHDQVKFFAVGTKVYSISKTNIGKIVLKYPSKAEQQKIVEFFSLIDQSIENIEEKIKMLVLQKKGIIPKLINEMSKYKLKKLGELASFVGGGTPSKTRSDYWSGSIPWVSSSDISISNIHKVDISRFITNEALKESTTKLIMKDSILIVSRVGVGKVAIAPGDLCTSQDFTNLTNIVPDSRYLAHYLSYLMILKSKMTQGTSIKGITLDEIKNYDIKLPSDFEQKRIADLLDRLDDRIRYNEMELEFLISLKRGLLSRMFI
jgi:type I restriction enzyme S subunit